MIRFVLCELADAPEQLKPALLLLPNVLAVMLELPDITVSPADPMPHDPPQA